MSEWRQQRRIAAHPTTYNGVRFRSRLEARWAAFFDLVKWEWEYEPIDLQGWVPDFWIQLPCDHSECPSGRELYAEVKPFRYIQEFAGTKVAELYESDPWSSPHPAMFGITPAVTRWQMCHGHGGGVYTVPDWAAPLVERIPGGGRIELVGIRYQFQFDQTMHLWRAAGNEVQWRGEQT